MNIENDFDIAEVYLEMAHEKFNSQDYSSSLVSLTKAYSHVRSLIELIYKMDREVSAAAHPAGYIERGPSL